MISIDLFSRKDVLHFIEKYYHTSLHSLAFKQLLPVRSEQNEVLAQLALWQKAKQKVPTFVAYQLLFTKLMYEQCTSESVANFKSQLFRGKKLLDMTAGMGVDAYCLGKKFEHLTLIEPDEEKLLLLDYNFKKLNPPFSYEIKLSSANDVIMEADTYDVIYIDPDRRHDTKAKQMLLEDCMPNVMQLMPKLHSFPGTIAIKLSPMLDITYIQQKLSPNNIYCIAEQGEMKEILVTIRPTAPAALANIAAVEIFKDKHFIYQNQKLDEPVITDKHFFYECGNAIIKSGMCDTYITNCRLQPVNVNATFAEGKYFIADFMGRKFEIIHYDNFSKNNFSAALHQFQINKCNITCRNFVLSPSDLYHKFKLKEGGVHYVFFTSTIKGEKIFFITKPCHPEGNNIFAT